MTRQDQFKEELFALLRKYKTEMTVEEKDGCDGPYAVGINFYSWSIEETEHIDFTTGIREDGTSE